MKSFDELKDEDLELITHALYQAFSNLSIKHTSYEITNKANAMELCRKLQSEINYRKDKGVFNNES